MFTLIYGIICGFLYWLFSAVLTSTGTAIFFVSVFFVYLAIGFFYGYFTGKVIGR